MMRKKQMNKSGKPLEILATAVMLLPVRFYRALCKMILWPGKIK
jgi:hypothetical protein